MIKTFANIPGVEWVDETGEFVRIDQEKCQCCGNCYKVCLGGCYEVGEKKVTIKSLDTCMECGACWYVCENDAIFFSWPNGGTGFKTELG